MITETAKMTKSGLIRSVLSGMSAPFNWKKCWAAIEAKLKTLPLGERRIVQPDKNLMYAVGNSLAAKVKKAGVNRISGGVVSANGVLKQEVAKEPSQVDFRKLLHVDELSLAMQLLNRCNGLERAAYVLDSAALLSKECKGVA